MKRIMLLGLALLVLGLIITACQPRNSSVPPTALKPTPTPAPTPTPTPTLTPTPTGSPVPTPTPTGPGVAPQISKRAPNFQLPSLSGRAVSLNDLRGKPVFLNFWASWCDPCRAEMPFIQGIYSEWSAKGLVLFTINVGETPFEVSKFVQDNRYSFPVLLDTNEMVYNQYNIRGIPTSFFIDSQGVIQQIRIGSYPNKAAIEADLAKIVK